MSVSDNGLIIGVAGAAVLLVVLDVRCVVDEASEDRVLLPPNESRTLDILPKESRILEF